MGYKEEDRIDYDAADRDEGQATSGVGRWEGCRRFGAHRHHKHDGRHRDPGTQADRGWFDFLF